MIIDSRTDVGQQFESGHIKGAIPVPLVEITEGRWIPPADLNKEIVFYCSCPSIGKNWLEGLARLLYLHAQDVAD